MIAPHGGRLVKRVLAGEEREAALARAKDLPRLEVSRETLRDMQNICEGVFSPLEGPLEEADLASVLREGRLRSGVAWTIPILLDVSREQAKGLEPGAEVLLWAEGDKGLCLLHLREKFFYDKELLARSVYGTDDPAHPGVERVQGMGEVLLAGEVDLLEPVTNPFERWTLTPRETRLLFREKGWRTTGAFQTRNIPHLGHENLQKTMLSLVDGLLIQPIIGKKKKGDFQDGVILKSYEVLIKNYFPANRVVLSILPTEMRYAGPREAIHHAIMRKNYGCTHFVVGRDHAGVGNYYDKEAAIEIFQEFADLEIEPVTIRGDFFHCRRCGTLASERTCPHGASNHINFSGTEIRRMLREGGTPPPEIMRPEVFAVLRQEPHPFVE